MAQKGLIMSIEDNKKAVVLTASGEFRKVNLPKKGSYDIGEELIYDDKSFLSSLNTSKWGMIAAAVLVIMVIPLLWKNMAVGPAQEVAYVNIDINPSIELSLDKSNLVIKAKGINGDGKRVLSALNVEKLSAQDAVNKITNKAKEFKYLAANKDNLVVISVTSKDNVKYDSLRGNLEKEVKNDLTTFNLKGRVETLSTTPELKAEADKLNISTGKYAVLLAAMDSGLNISVEEMRSKSIAKAIRGLGGDVKSIVEKAHKVNNFNLLAVKYEKHIKKYKNSKDAEEDNENITNNNDNQDRILNQEGINSNQDENNNTDNTTDKGKIKNSKKNNEENNKNKNVNEENLTKKNRNNDNNNSENNGTKKNKDSNANKVKNKKSRDRKKVNIKPVLVKPYKPDKSKEHNKNNESKNNDNNNQNNSDENEG